MKSYLLLIFILLSLLGIPEVHAQSDDFGIWMSAGVKKEIKKWTFEMEEELRTADHSGEIERIATELSVEYDLLKPLTLGVAYQFIDFHDLENDDFQPRHRINFYVQGKKKWGDFTFSLRERVQNTYKDESERSYKINPKWSWRNKAKAEYNIPHCRINPYLSFETFYQLNNPDGNKFDGLRYTLGGDYKISKHHKINLFGLIDKEINVKNPVREFVIGTGYTYSF